MSLMINSALIQKLKEVPRTGAEHLSAPAKTTRTYRCIVRTPFSLQSRERTTKQAPC